MSFIDQDVRYLDRSGIAARFTADDLIDTLSDSSKSK